MTSEQINQTIKDWYANRKDELLIISGWAGCGKTYVAKQIPDILGVQGVFLTPTGKAAVVLHSRAMTIHSYRYQPTEDEDGNLKFIRKPKEECEGDLLIIDEISMVNKELLNDLISLGKPMIGLGDPAQLPPVKGTNDILDNPDIFLTKVWRNDGGILELSKDVRETGFYILGKEYHNVRIRSIFNYQEEIKRLVTRDDSIVLVKFNNTRRSLNRLVRKEVFNRHKPIEVGERLICLKNNKDFGIMNGMIFTLLAIKKEIAWANAALVRASIDGIGERDLLLDLDIIKGKTTEVKQSYPKKIKLHRSDRQSVKCCEVDYGYVITTHKSQGSEFKHVVVVNEGINIGDHQKWLYTAVTRARESLVIYD